MSILADIKARLSLATKGPWVTGPEARGTVVYAEEGSVTICRAVSNRVQSRLDANFIAHAKEDIEMLLKMVEKQEERIRELEKELSRRNP